MKAGSTGRLRSLHRFLAEKGRRVGLRFDTAHPSIGEFDVLVPMDGESRLITIRLLSLPLYVAGQLDRILSDAQDMC